MTCSRQWPPQPDPCTLQDVWLAKL